MTEKKVFEYTDVKVKNIIFSNFTKINEKVVSKIWYKCDNNSRQQTLHIQTPYLKVQKVIDNQVFLFPDKIENFLDSLDYISYNFVNQNKHKYGFDKFNFTFETINNPIDDVDIMKIEIVNGNRPTTFYSSKNKCRLDYNDVVLSNCEKIKFIFELDGIIVDMKNKSIRNNIIIRDILVSELEPKLIELTEYSFIDSDTEQNIKPNDLDDKLNQINQQSDNNKQIVYNDQTDCDDSDKQIICNHKSDSDKQIVYNDQTDSDDHKLQNQDSDSDSSSSEKQITPVKNKNKNKKVTKPKPKGKRKN